MKKLLTFLGTAIIAGSSTSTLTAYTTPVSVHNTNLTKAKTTTPQYKYQILSSSHFANERTIYAIKSIQNGKIVYVGGQDAYGASLLTVVTRQSDGTYTYKRIVGGTIGIIYDIWASENGKVIVCGTNLGLVIYRLQPDGTYIPSWFRLGGNIYHTVRQVVFSSDLKTLYVTKASEGLYVVHFNSEGSHTIDHYQNIGGIQGNSEIDTLVLGANNKLFFATNNLSTPQFPPMLWTAITNQAGKLTFNKININPQSLPADTFFFGMSVSNDNKVFSIDVDVYKIMVGVLQSNDTYKISYYNFKDSTQVQFTAMTADAKTIIGSNGPYMMVGDNTGTIGQYVFHQEKIPGLSLSDTPSSVSISQNGQYVYAGMLKGLVVGTRINS